MANTNSNGSSKGTTNKNGSNGSQKQKSNGGMESAAHEII